MKLPQNNLLTLGNQAVVDFPKEDEAGRGMAPLELVLCEYCELLQLRHTVDADTLFRKFWYRSGINEQMRLELQGIVYQAKDKLNLRAGDWVADIGANDGTLLSFYDNDIYKVAFEPALELAEEIKARKIPNTFVTPSYFGETKIGKHTRFKIITAIAMFYDLDDPGKFLKDVFRVLAEDGMFVVQMNYLPEMLRKMAFDNIGHEHLCYYSLRVLDTLFKENGLTITEATTNNTNGGSIRLYAKKSSAVNHQGRLFWELHSMELDTLTKEKYQQFADNVRESCELLKVYLWQLKAKGKTVYAYGASTRGSTLLQTMLQNGNMLDYLKAAAERDPNKVGRRMAGVNLPIVDEDTARADAQYFLLLPYHFWDSIKDREYKWMAGGGKFILPVPEPRLASLERIGNKLVLCEKSLAEELGTNGWKLT